MPDKISITTAGRTVYWDLPDNGAVTVLQVLVQSLGPAKEDDPPKPKAEKELPRPPRTPGVHRGEPEYLAGVPIGQAHRGPEGEVLI